MKTIASISTALGSGAIGVVRMSGDNSLAIADALFTPFHHKHFKDALPNTMYLGVFSHKSFSDKVLCVYFKAPHSYTGEDLVEIQCHGGVRVVREVLNACLDCGAVIADKGEYTKRAFLNGKLALSDAEGIIDMINGESLSAVNAGYRIASGEISKVILNLENLLLDAISNLEAHLDFPDEMGDEVVLNVVPTLQEIITYLDPLINAYQQGKFLKNGINVAILGIANVGKSSLLNKLLNRERAIVTDIAGTTRDSLEEKTEIDGVMLNLIDTAGIRDTDDVVEKLGVERSLQAAHNADIVLFITEADRTLNGEEQSLLSSVKSKILTVYNKCDKGVCAQNTQGIKLSCKTGEGIEELKKEIVNTFINLNLDSGAPVLTSARHHDALCRARASLTSVIDNISRPTELLLIDLKDAYLALGEVSGNTASEDVIDRIFENFCIGK